MNLKEFTNCRLEAFEVATFVDLLFTRGINLVATPGDNVGEIQIRFVITMLLSNSYVNLRSSLSKS